MDETMLEKFTAEMDLLYKFALTGSDVMFKPRDYGTGEILNIVEIHTLSMIADDPGICISDVARRWNRTLGAASRNVDKLQSKGYIEKKKLDGNNKTIRLYPTEKGTELARLHSECDKQQVQMLTERVLNSHSQGEVINFFSVLRSINEIIKDI